MSKILPAEYPKPVIIEESKYDYDWYYENKLAFSIYGKVFTRELIDKFDFVVTQAQEGELMAGHVLGFIDPRNKLPLEGESYLDTIGYFLDQSALTLAEGGISLVKMYYLTYIL